MIVYWPRLDDPREPVYCKCYSCKFGELRLYNPSEGARMVLIRKAIDDLIAVHVKEHPRCNNELAAIY